MKNLTQKAMKQIICVFVCAVLLSVTVTPCFAVGSEAPVKVGFFAFSGYHDEDASGNRSGYGYDILQYISVYSDIQWDYAGYEMSWQEAQDRLESGEIDLLTSAQKTPARLEKFDFSDLPIGTSAAILTVKAGNARYILGDYANWSGIRVGLIEGNSRNDGLARFAAEHGFTYTAVYFADTESMLDALQSGVTVDAVVTSNLRKTDNEWILAQFDASPFYVIVKKGNDELLAKVNGALSLLYAAAPNLNETLMEKYYLSSSGANIAFTVDESRLIKASASDPVRVGIMLSGAPICYRDSKTGEYMGITMELLRTVALKTGLNFEYVVIDQSKESPIELLKNGAVDIVARVFKTEAFTSDVTLILSDTLLTDSVAIVGRMNDDFTENAAQKKIAVPSGFITGQDYVRSYFPEHELVLYDTDEECLKAVTRGDADAAAYLYNRMTYLLLNPHYEQISIIQSYHFNLQSSVAGLAGKDEDLISIINKGLAMITESERNAIILDYTVLNTYELSFADTIYKFRQPIIIIAALVLLLVFAMTAMLLMKRKNEKKLLTAYAHAQDAMHQAEQASAAKGQFLSRVSHEMRTPLNAIIGFLELSKDAGEEEAKTYLQNAGIAAKQLLLVINDVLDMSAIEAGKMSIASAPFDFRQLIHSVTNVFLPQCERNNVRFESVLLTPVDEWLIGDQLRVNQILFNLLNNAVKFTKKGSITLRISQLRSSDTQVFIRFEVSDTGCGMSEEMQSRLFKPFEQESSHTAAKYGCSGLGLSIVKNLVTMMQGAIQVQSESGVGTTFTVDLPFGRSEPKLSFSLPNEAKKLRVLAVDDEAMERSYMAALLKRMEVRYTCVPDADAAIEELESGVKANDEYQVCLIDWKMPKIDGVEATRQIRSKFGENMLLIVISAYEHNQASENTKTAGANLFLPKPLFQSSLFDLFMTLTGGKIGNKEDPIAVENADFTGRRVLLAEDNIMNRIVAQALLKKLGIMSECAEDGQMAVDKFCTSPSGYYDAILMDIQMPVMDGYEATGRIRASSHPDAGTVQIIALTANAFNEDIAKVLSAGMNEHVAKPIETAKLITALSRTLKASCVK